MESVVVQQLRERAKRLTAQVETARRELAQERAAREAAEYRLANPGDAQLESGLHPDEWESLAAYSASTMDGRQLMQLFIRFSRTADIESTRRICDFIAEKKPFLAAPIRINMAQLEASRAMPAPPTLASLQQ